MYFNITIWTKMFLDNDNSCNLPWDWVELICYSTYICMLKLGRPQKIIQARTHLYFQIPKWHHNWKRYTQRKESGESWPIASVLKYPVNLEQHLTRYMANLSPIKYFLNYKSIFEDAQIMLCWSNLSNRKITLCCRECSASSLKR